MNYSTYIPYISDKLEILLKFSKVIVVLLCIFTSITLTRLLLTCIIICSYCILIIHKEDTNLYYIIVDVLASSHGTETIKDGFDYLPPT